MWLGKSLVGDRPSWHKEPINFFNKMLSIRKVRLLNTSRYMSMQSYECVIISKMFLIYFISYGCNDSALVFLGGAEASASPSFALPMFITIKNNYSASVFRCASCHCGWHRHTLAHPWLRPWCRVRERLRFHLGNVVLGLFWRREWRSGMIIGYRWWRVISRNAERRRCAFGERDWARLLRFFDKNLYCEAW